MDVDKEEKEDAFAEAKANFKINPYADTATSSVSSFRVITLLMTWGIDLKCPIRGFS